MKIFLNMTLSEFKIALRNIVFMIFTLLLPLLLIFLFGGLYGNEPSRLFENGAINMSTPAYIALALTVVAFTGLPMQLVSYKENKVLKRLKATPIKKWQILMPIFISFLALFLIGTILLILAGVIFFDLKFSGNFFAFLLAFILSIAAMFSMGFLLSCLVKNTKQVSAIGFTLLIPFIFLSGATMPMSAFPDVMTSVSKAIPITYCVEFMQNTFLGKPFGDNLVHIIVLSAITLVCVVLSIKLFKWE